MINAVIFDYGGTLVKHTKPWNEVRSMGIVAVHALLVRKGLKMPLGRFVEVDKSVFDAFAESEERENRDIPDIEKHEELVSRLFPGRPIHWRTEVAEDAVRAFADVVVKNHRPADGLKHTLKTLDSMGLKMAVVSNHNNHDGLVRHLDDLDVGDYFLRVFSSSEVGSRKPSRKIFDLCLAALSLVPSEAIYVGNSIDHDVVGAKSAGLACIWIDSDPGGLEEPMTSHRGGMNRRPAMEPDFTVGRLAEIPQIIRALNSA